MRRRSRIALRVLLGLPLLLLLVLFLYLRFGDLSGYHATVERLVTEALGRRLTIAGRFEPHIALSSTLIAEDVSLANPEWCERPEMIHVDRLSFTLDLWSLVSGPIRVREVEIEGARAGLETGPEGQRNWKFDLPEPKKPDRPRRETPAIVFESGRLRSVELSYRDPARTRAVVLDLESLELLPAGEETQELRLEGRLDDLPVELGGRLGPLYALFRGRDVKHDLSGRLGDMDLSLRGTVGEFATLEGSELRASIGGPEIATLTGWLQLPSLGEGRFRAVGEVSPSAAGVDLRLDAAVDELEVSAKGSVSALLNPRELDLDLKAKVPDLAALGALLGVDDLPAESLRASGRVRRSSSRLSFERVDLAIGENSLSLQGVLGSLPDLLETDLRFEGAGPDLSSLRVLAGVKLPSGAFEVSGHLLRVAKGVKARELRARVGDLALSLEGLVGDAPSFVGTDLEIRGEGPDLSVLTGVAGVDLPAESFRVEGRLSQGEAGMSLEGFEGRLGEATLALDGTIRPEEGLVGTDLRLQVEGPDLARAASVAGREDLPREPFEVEGRVRIQGNGYLLNGVRARVGNLSLSAEGRLGRLPRALGTDLRLDAQGSELAWVAALAGLPGLPAEPFGLAGRVQVLDEGYGLEGVEARVGDLKAGLHGRVGPLPDLLGTQLRIEAEGGSLAALRGFHEKIPALPDAAFEVAGDLGFDGTGLVLGGVEGELGGNRIAGSGNLGPLPSLSATDLSLELSGPDLARAAALAEEAGVDLGRELPAEPFEIAGGVKLLPQGYELRELHLRLGTAQVLVHGTLGAPPAFSASDLSVEAEGPDGSLVGRIAGVTLPEEAFRVRGRVARRVTGLRFHQTVADLGEYHLELDGNLGELPKLIGTNLDLLARGPDLRLLGEFVDFPRLPQGSFDISGHLAGDPEEFTLDDFSARLGQSDLSGTVRVDLRGKVAVEGELRSERFHLTPWLGGEKEGKNADSPDIEVGVASAAPGADVGEKKSATAGGTAPRSRNRRVIPDLPFDLAFLDRFDADLSWSVGEILNRDRTLDDFELNARLIDGALRVDPVRAAGPYGGDASARFILEPVEEGYQIRLAVVGRDLRLLLSGVTEPEIRPLAKFEVELRAAGRSIREMALSAEAWAILATGPGKLDNKGLDLLGMDLLNEIFMTLNPFAKEDPYTHVECMVTAVVVQDGVARVAPLALRTSKTTLVGQGRIRFEKEELDLSWTAKPRKGVGLTSTTALTNPYLKLGGTLADPRVEVKPLQAVATTSVAVATVGLSLVARGMWDRVTSGKNVCRKAKKELARWIEEEELVESRLFGPEAED